MDAPFCSHPEEFVRRQRSSLSCRTAAALVPRISLMVRLKSRNDTEECPQQPLPEEGGIQDIAVNEEVFACLQVSCQEEFQP